MKPGEEPVQSVRTAPSESKHIWAFYCGAQDLLLFWTVRFFSLCLCLMGLSLFISVEYIITISSWGQQTFTFLWKQSRIEQSFLEITPVAGGKYLLCNSVSDEPREFWDSKTGSHFIFANTGGKRWGADAQKTLESWKRPVRVLFSEMFPWAVQFPSFERGKQWKYVFIFL